MKKYLVIGNPINHSLSPELHNHWINQVGLDAIYEKKKLDNNDLENLILDVIPLPNLTFWKSSKKPINPNKINVNINI